MKYNEIQWIFFDVGGVLLDDSKPEILRQEIILKLAGKYAPNLILQDVRNAWMEASKIPGSVRLNALRILIPSDYEYKTAADELTSSLPKDHYLATSTVRPETKGVLTELKKHYSLGLLANQSVKVTELLEEAGVLQLLDHSQVSAHTGLEKPNPEYFRSVLKSTGTTAEACVFVDDNWFRGLLPAKQLGMKVVLLERDIVPYPPEANPNHTITNLSELIPLLT